MTTPESRLAEFVVRQPASELPSSPRNITRLVTLAAIGTGIAGSGEDGIDALRGLVRTRGGAPQARTFVFGDRLPAHAAARLNGTMCRALDYCDAMAPGIHIGSSLLPAAFAAAELAGGCSGSDLLAALAVGCEVGARFNLTEAMYDGFDPTGVAIVFASTAAAARVLRLDERQCVHALGLAFNRCGGSFQSNIDGSLAVRMIQGWVAETGVECAQMAQAGITGPVNFLGGVYGYPHLYGRDRLDPEAMVASLGDQWRLGAMMFKKFPSCGATQGMTELTLQMVGELDLAPEDVRSVDVRLPPYSYRLVGHDFRIGDNPRVNAQFSAQYCVASAIVRRASRLPHFNLEQVMDPRVQDVVRRVRVTGDSAMDARGHTAVDVRIAATDGRVVERSLDIAPGFPGNALSDAEQLARFHDCMAHAPRPLEAQQIARFVAAVDDLEAVADARALVDLLIAPH